MVESFKRRKKQALIGAVSLSVGLGLSAAAFVFGAWFLIVRLTGDSFPTALGILVSVGAGALVAGGTLLLLYPTVKRFAKKLDKEYALGEKAQTMVEYSSQSGAVIQLQREQAEEVISSLPKKKKSFFDIAKVAVLPILATATLITAVVVPKSEKGDSVPPPVVFQPTEYQLKDLKALIANIDGSEMEEGLKGQFLSFLQPISDLLTVDEGEDLPLAEDVIFAVKLAMNQIIGATRSANSYNALSDAIVAITQATEEILPAAIAEEEPPTGEEPPTEEEVALPDDGLKKFARALRESGKIYKKVDGIALSRYATLEGKKPNLHLAVKSRLEDYAQEVAAILQPFTEAEYIAYATEYAARLKEALLSEPFAAVAESDSLKKATVSLQAVWESSVSWLDEDTGYTLEGVKTDISKALTKFIVEEDGKAGAAFAFETQAHSFMYKDYSLLQLSQIFAVPIPDEGEDEEDEETKDDDGGGDVGDGSGSGETEYPNEGLVLDPTDGTYKPYYVVIGTYQDTLLQLIAEGKITKEMADYLEAYFSALLETNGDNQDK